MVDDSTGSIARKILTRFQERFPPMYREGEGLRYSLSVFLGRVRALAIGTALFLMLVCVWAYWFVVS